MIRRLFLILAAVAAGVLLADLVMRFLESSITLIWVGVVATLMVHALTFDYLRASERRVRRLARSRDLPDWVAAQAEKNRRKGWVGEVGGLPMVAVALVMSSYRGGWPLVLFSASVAFQLGAFVAEFVIINAQARLVGEVEGWLKKPEAKLDEVR